MNLLIDSNVILDMVQHREPFSASLKTTVCHSLKP